MSERRVLVIDDDRGIQDVVAFALADEGFVVRVASNGREALRLLDEWTPDCILLDLMMPVMDGWAFRDALLHQPDRAEIPVVILSAGRDLGVEKERLAAARFIPKPFDLDVLLDTVERLTRDAA